MLEKSWIDPLLQISYHIDYKQAFDSNQDSELPPQNEIHYSFYRTSPGAWQFQTKGLINEFNPT